MRYTIKYNALMNPKAVKKLPKHDFKIIRSAIEEKLTEHAHVFGKPLRHSLRGHRSLRVGDYRVVYRIAGTDVLILAIQHRSIIYEEIERRLGN